MKRKRLSKSEIKSLNKDLSSFNFSFDKKDNVEMIEDNNILYILKDRVLLFIKANDILFPTLLNKDLESLSIPYIEVDMNAVPFLTKGADIMRPGVTKFTDFEKNQVIFVKDTNNKKIFCIAYSLENSQTLKNLKNGKAFINLHHVGDKYWNYNN